MCDVPLKWTDYRRQKLPDHDGKIWWRLVVEMRLTPRTGLDARLRQFRNFVKLAEHGRTIPVCFFQIKALRRTF
jgi:hypothetical protein